MTGSRIEETQHGASPLEPTLAPPQLVTRVLLGLLDFYRRWISPAIHAVKPGGCRYLPTCSEYASLAIATHGPLQGIGLAIWRLLRCNPFMRGGLDPVPPAHDSRHCQPKQLP